MAKHVKMGTNARLYQGTVLIGCADSIKYSVKADKLPTKCQGTAGTNTAEPGDLSYEWSISALWKMFTSSEESTNISAKDWFTAVKSATEITIKFQGEETDDDVYTGVGYTENLEMNAKLNENGSISVSGWFNSLAVTQKPA